MRRTSIVAAALTLAAYPALAIEWICTTPSAPERWVVSAADDATFEPASINKGRGRQRLDPAQIAQAYSGQPVLVGHTWLLAVMLPANHPDTRAAFGEMGLSAAAAQRMASGRRLVDRGIVLVRTPAELLQKVANNPPAVGYTGFFPGGTDVELCF